MDSVALAVFVEAVSAGSLAGAARRLGLGSLAAGRSLASLEQRLGVRLLQRNTRSRACHREGCEGRETSRSGLGGDASHGSISFVPMPSWLGVRNLAVLPVLIYCRVLMLLRVRY